MACSPIFAFIILMLCSFTHIHMTNAIHVFNVKSYGAIGDGKEDDTEAFIRAWQDSCSTRGSSTVLIPPKSKYLVGPVDFQGPCHGAMTFQIMGDIVAPNQNDVKVWKSDQYTWLQWSKVSGLSIIATGKATINGNGQSWWNCRKQKKCSHAPTAVTVRDGKEVSIRNIKLMNSQQIHLNIQNSENVEITGASITAPYDSPNTDGIHIGDSHHVTITSSDISTGDDCVSIVSRTSDIRVNNLRCNAGHGISIGSLNKNAFVSNISVTGARLTNTTNGLRIKTWQGGSGVAENIDFMNIIMNAVRNPIIVDQFYCNSEPSGSCGTKSGAVQIQNVSYEKIVGSSTSKVAIKLNCSDSIPCTALTLSDINLSMSDKSESEAECNNAHGTIQGQIYPVLRCLKV